MTDSPNIVELFCQLYTEMFLLMKKAPPQVSGSAGDIILSPVA